MTDGDDPWDAPTGVGGTAASEPSLQEAGTVRRPAGTPPADTPHHVEAYLREAPGKDEFPVSNWDRYRVVSFLGEGGMGRVYEAFDPRLGRNVALKFIRGDDRELVQRFLQEARSQAKVEHENICKIYETGEVQGKLYIAMQLIHGKPFGESSSAMKLEQKVLAVAQVAEALHAAHRLGLIHRDIKPANIMVEQTEDGGFKPYLMDFGLARESSTPGHTVTGMVVGTPAYMPPEQAMGDVHHVDRRSDVYSLGATLYHTLTGQAPFQGSGTLSILQQVTGTDPLPVRKIAPSVPADLQTIVAKAMEKDPGRRYESARALAEDLRRYLDGEPVQARPASLAYRLWKKGRKNRALVAVSATAMVLIAAFALLAFHSWWNARERAQLARRFGQKAKEIEVLMRFASYMQPLHDTRIEQRIVQKQLEAIAAEMTTAGDLGTGPGNYALGRGELALGNPAKAHQHLQAAWNSGYHEPEVAYALGLAMASRYDREMKRLYAVPEERRELRKTELKSTLLRPALEYLSQGLAVEIESPHYARALIAYYHSEWDSALRLAAQAFEQIPWLYEAHRLRGNALVARAGDNRNSGRLDAARDDLVEAKKSYTRAVSIARSDPLTYTELCNMWDQFTEVSIERRMPPHESVQEAMRACQDAITANPDEPLPYLKLSDAYWRLSEYRVHGGEEAGKELDLAIEAAQKSLSLEPSAYAHDNIGIIYAIKSDEVQKSGGDPSELFERSIESFRQGIKLDSTFESLRHNVGLVTLNFAAYRMESGRDPGPQLRESIDVFEQHRAMKGELYATSTGALATAYAALAAYEWAQGADPFASLDHADRYAKEALAVHPGHFDSLSARILSLCLRAKYELAAGKSPAGSLAEAGKALADLRLRSPDAAETHRLEGLLQLLTALTAPPETAAPEAGFAAARDHLRRAAALGSADARPETVEASLREAEGLLARRRNALRAIDTGLADVRNLPHRTPRTLALEGALLSLKARITNSVEDRTAAARLLSSALDQNPYLAREFQPYQAIAGRSSGSSR